MPIQPIFVFSRLVRASNHCQLVLGQLVLVTAVGFLSALIIKDAIVGTVVNGSDAPQTHTDLASKASHNLNPKLDDELASKGFAIIEKYCSKCHGENETNGNDEFHILDRKSYSTDYIIKEDLANSMLWQRVAANEMPPEEAPQLDAEQKETLEQWVKAGAPFPQDNLPASPAPQDSDTAVQDEHAEQISKEDLRIEGVRILTQYCDKCHTKHQWTAADRKNLIDSPKKYVVPGDSAASLIWKRAGIKRNMPPKKDIDANKATAVSDKDLAILKRWIEEGAEFPNHQPRGEFVSEAGVWKMTYEYLRKQNEGDRPYLRFFSFANVYNNYIRYTDQDFALHPFALSKVVNSMSWKSRVVPPTKVDDRGILWCIDLRDYGWDDLDFEAIHIKRYSAWNLLLSEYPYGIKQNQVDDQETRESFDLSIRMTQSSMPIIRGDWFIFNGAQGSLYYLIAKIPGNIRRLEAALKINLEDDFLRQKLFRAALIKSGVSLGNRLMDRHDTSMGYYWISYDFSEGGPKSNLRLFPLGPAFERNQYPKLAFDHDGGEVIFSLPNGMQAYVLTDDKGNRIEKGPTNIVSDATFTTGSSEVVNAISCMNCHADGMRDFDDTVKANIGIEGEPKRFAERLFDPRNELSELLLRDRQQFRKALNIAWQFPGDELTGLRESNYSPGTEPIAVVADRYRRNLNAFDLVVELGNEPVEFKVPDMASKFFLAQVKANQRLKSTALIGATEVTRKEWDQADASDESLFQTTCSEFGYGSSAIYLNSDAQKIFDAYRRNSER